MGFLRVTSDQLDGMYELSGESIKVGRSRDNRIRLPHKSISRHHATLAETDQGLIVKDLASSYGTYINEDKVSEGRAEAGDVIRFGRICLVYEVENATSPAAAPLPSPTGSEADELPASSAGGRLCDKHPGNQLSLVCPKCRLRFCDSCVTRAPVSGIDKSICPYCKEACKPLGFFQLEEDRRKARESHSFFRELPEVLGHPFSAVGVSLLLVGTIIHVALSYAAGVSPYLLILPLFYLMAHAHRITAAAASGQEELPAWPSPADMGSEVLRPGLLFAASAVTAFLPLAAYLAWAFNAGEATRPAAVFPLTVWGLLYLPFAVVATGAKDGFEGLNPITVLSAYSRLHLQFMFSALLLLTLVAIRFVLENAFAAFIHVPALPEVMTGFVTVVTLMLAMRLFGKLYHTNRNELRWH